MANPQKENGNTQIANEILDALCKFRIPGEVRQVVDFIIRKTYGWHKKFDMISNSQIMQGTGLLKGSVSRSVKKAIKHKIIIANETKVGFNKNYDEWIEFGGYHFNPKPVIANETKVIASDNKKLSQVRDTKEKKETIQKKDDFSFKGTTKKRKPHQLPAPKRINDKTIIDGQGFIKRLDHNTSKISKIYGKDT